MKITEIELFHLNIPLKETFWPTWIPGYPQTHNRFTLIRIATDEGIEGWSAGTAMGTEREGMGDLLGGYLIGADPTDIDRVQSLLKQASFLGWLNFWIEPACWDIIGKAKGKPVYEILGGTARPVEVYNSFGELHEPGQRVQELLALKEKGFRVFKLRVKAKEFRDDVKLIEEVRKGVGPDPVIGVDANQGWLVSIVDRVPAWDLQRAKDFAKACADNKIEWLEEPLDWHDYDGLAELKRASPVSISGAELNHGWDEIKIMFEKDCFHIYQPDACFAGGIQQVMKVIDACHKHGRLFSPHTWSNGIGFYIGWNLVLADKENHKPIEYPNEPPSWIPEFRDGIIEPIIPDKNAMLQPFNRPGLGFEIDKKLLKKYGRSYYKANERSLAFKVIKDKGLKAALDLSKRKKAEGG